MGFGSTHGTLTTSRNTTPWTQSARQGGIWEPEHLLLWAGVLYHKQPGVHQHRRQKAAKAQPLTQSELWKFPDRQQHGRHTESPLRRDGEQSTSAWAIGYAAPCRWAAT